MKKSKRTWKPAYDASMRLFDAVTGDEKVSVDKVKNMWYNVFNSALKYMGFPRHARQSMWEGLVCGNWKRLHLTNDELEITSKHWLEELAWDVRYCSDRWTLDRIARCHWMYRAYLNACVREKGEKRGRKK